MSSKKLYIIGNGFDLHHGLKSSYWDFKEYLEDKDGELVEKIEKYFGSDTLWSDFEESMAYLNSEEIVDDCMVFLQPYGDEDWSDASHHDYEYELQRRIDLITETLKQRFTEWILNLRIPESATHNKVVIDKLAKFVCFNYTDTLERLYKVARNNILYIHNKAINSSSILILGHSRNPQYAKTLDELYNDEDTDVRIAEGNRILDYYFSQTYKSTKTIISENVDYFNDFDNVEIIYVFGHSLSVVDQPYFKEIVTRIDDSKVKWKVSFHNKKDLNDFQEFFRILGISPSLIEYDKMNNFDNTQLMLFTKDNE